MIIIPYGDKQMDELLKKLLEAEILSEDTKVELEAAFASQLSEAVESEKVRAREEIRVELSEQWVAEREQLIEAMDTKIDDFLTEEMEELKGDLSRFRDLEVEYAEKLVEAESKLAKQLEADTEELVEKLDTFLEMRLTAELNELKEDIAEAKKSHFGKQVFEAFSNEYKNNFVDQDKISAELKESQQELRSTLNQLKKAERKLEENVRGTKINGLLKPLKGSQRDVMETILNNLPTKDLDTGYSTFIGRVLKEGEKESIEKETKVLAEDTKAQTTTEVVKEGTVKTGNLENEATEEEKVIQENLDQQREAAKAKLRRLSGLEG
jgi:hypothetical protein